jgi:hypothetical protein
MYKLIKNPEQFDVNTGTIISSLNDYAIRLSDGANVHRELNEEYLKWIAEGNTPEPADE